MTFYEATAQPKVKYVSALIGGSPKLGKTRLAALFPNAFFIDVDNGAGHANAARINFTKTPDGYWNYCNLIYELSLLQPGEDGLLSYSSHFTSGHTIKIGSVVWDSLSEFQMIAGLVAKDDPNNKFAYYRDIKKLVEQPMNNFLSIKAHQIIVSHTKERGEKDQKFVTSIGMDLEGSLRDTIHRWMDVILNIVHDPYKQATWLFTTETVVGKQVVQAGDRYHIFGGQNRPLYVATDTGKMDIDHSIVDQILSIVDGNAQETANSTPVWTTWKSGTDVFSFAKSFGWDQTILESRLAKLGPLGLNLAQVYFNIITSENPAAIVNEAPATQAQVAQSVPQPAPASPTAEGQTEPLWNPAAYSATPVSAVEYSDDWSFISSWLESHGKNPVDELEKMQKTAQDQYDPTSLASVHRYFHTVVGIPMEFGQAA